MLITLLICYTGRQEKCNFIWQLFISIVYISTVNSKILTILCSRHARKIALFQGFIPLKKGHSHKLHITVTFLVSSGLQMTMMKQSIDVFFLFVYLVDYWWLQNIHHCRPVCGSLLQKLMQLCMSKILPSSIQSSTEYTSSDIYSMYRYVLQYRVSQSHCSSVIITENTNICRLSVT